VTSPSSHLTIESGCSSACADVTRSCVADGIRIATPLRSGREGTRTPEKLNTQVSGLGVRRGRYSPLTRTRRKPLICGFATPWRSPTLRAPRPSAKRPCNVAYSATMRSKPLALGMSPDPGQREGPAPHWACHPAPLPRRAQRRHPHRKDLLQPGQLRRTLSSWS
jgi:hypothetical protein